MPSCCTVPRCSSKTGGHKFPSDPVLRKKWLIAIRRESFVPTKYSRVCSKHFKRDDYKYTGKEHLNNIDRRETCRKRLRKYAVPSVFYWTNPSIFVKDELMLKKLEHNTQHNQMEESVLPDLNEVNVVQCRSCLLQINDNCVPFYVFNTWDSDLPGANDSVAQHLNRLAEIQITAEDKHSKLICNTCLSKIKDVVSFITMVQENDVILNQYVRDEDTEMTWPKPILVDKNISHTSELQIEIKQEVMSDDENGSPCSEQEMDLEMDIKIEPEEIQEDSGMNNHTIDNQAENNAMDEQAEKDSEVIHSEGKVDNDLGMDIMDKPLRDRLLDGKRLINRTITDSNNETAKDEHSMCVVSDVKSNTVVPNGNSDCGPKLIDKIKEECLSDDEMDIDSELPLDCMLCMKVFRSVSGLKAHVIAQHSYGTVSRNIENTKDTNKRKYYCTTCNKLFVSQTDLVVHETCHGQYACFACNAKFDSFQQLSKHRKRCKSSNKDPVSKVITLEDVMRRSPEISSVTTLGVNLDETVQPSDIDERESAKIFEEDRIIDKEMCRIFRNDEVDSNAEIHDTELSKAVENEEIGEEERNIMNEDIAKSQNIFDNELSKVVENEQSVVNEDKVKFDGTVDREMSDTGKEESVANEDIAKSDEMVDNELSDTENEVISEKEESVANDGIAKYEMVDKEMSDTENDVISEKEESVANDGIAKYDKMVDKEMSDTENDVISEKEESVANEDIAKSEEMVDKEMSDTENDVISEKEECVANEDISKSEIVDKELLFAENEVISKKEDSIAKPEKMVDEELSDTENDLISEKEESNANKDIAKSEERVEKELSDVENEEIGNSIQIVVNEDIGKIDETVDKELSEIGVKEQTAVNEDIADESVDNDLAKIAIQVMESQDNSETMEPCADLMDTDVDSRNNIILDPHIQGSPTHNTGSLTKSPENKKQLVQMY